MPTTYTKDRDQIIAENPLLAYCERLGYELRRDGPHYKCCCPFHQERTPSFTLYADNHYHCFGCGVTGSVIDLHMHVKSMTFAEAIRDLGGEAQPSGGKQFKPKPHDKAQSNVQGSGAGTPPASRKPGEEVCAYDYQDETGTLIYQVVRYDPKTFKQCRIIGGLRAWNMEGVERVPYRLPEIKGAEQPVWIVEGEKDVENLRGRGFIATCNPGGAGKWLPAYSQWLRGKQVIICPDNDEVGRKHGREVLKSLEGLVEWAKFIQLPAEHEGHQVKDVSDLLAWDPAGEVLMGLVKRAVQIDRAIEMGAHSLGELESHYASDLERFGEISLALCNWIPGLGVQQLMPGDVLGILANTGHLKTAAMQNIVACNPALPTLFCQLEISGTLMFERSVAIATGMDASEVQRVYRSGGRVDWRSTGKFRNLLICSRALTMHQIDELVARSSAKLGEQPRLVVIDYVQLVKPERAQSDRYERVSDACEEGKRLAKKWNLIVAMVSQVSRKEGGHKSLDDDKDTYYRVGLHDAKGSGSFENSCTVVVGIWKTGDSTMRAKVLKNSRGLPGREVAMRIKGGSYVIEQDI